MIGKTIWERYLFKEILKVFFLFLFSFFFLYALIDYSMHVQEIIKSQKIQMKDFFTYYLMLLSKRADLLLPLALLIATLKVFTSLNRKSELIAFQSGGIGIKRLLRPFFFLGTICLALIYINFEFVIPRSLTFIERFEQKHFRTKKTLKKKQEGVHLLPFEDGSRMIYQKYDPEKDELFDVYWIFSANQFWSFKTIALAGPTPIGYHVDRLERSTRGLIEKKDSHEILSLPSLKFDFDLKNSMVKPMESRSISELYQLHKSSKTLWEEKKSMIATHLYYKLLMPSLPLLVIIGAAPFATRFSRHLPVFALFSLGIFGYIALYTLIGASVILGEAHVISPLLALFTVPLLFLLFFGRKMQKVG